MDIRKELIPGSILDFPGMHCTIEKEIGRGSNAIVYQGTYPDLLNRDEKHIVLIKELFPFHQKAAIYRNENNEIVCLPEGQETYEIHRQSFEYGNKIHLKMLEKHPELTGENINTFSENRTEYTVLGYTGGRSLESDMREPADNLKKLALRMLGLLDALEVFHDSGFLHLDIAPDNILLIGYGTKERVMLIDYNSVYDMNQIQQDSPMYYSVKQGYTAPEIRSGKKNSISTASDMYSVAAVFYRCLAGVPLTSFQMIRPAPPDVSGCDCLRDMPETVISMIKQILYTGLQSLPHRRYQNVVEMREAVQELLDRIEGVGITHWAIWEAGKKTVQKVIRDNPSFSYLNCADTLFPSNVAIDEEHILPMAEYMDSMVKEGGKHTILSASGGMGKTTALLRTITEQSSKYSPLKPAIAYISLYGWKEGSTTYIQDRILENLHYSTETTSFENARQMLRHVIEKPLQTKDGNVPTLLLFLDGLNEASGSTQALTDEILMLSSMEGVRMLAASRTDVPILPFAHISLMPLTPENVKDILYDHKLLLPESEQVQELLQTPLMLSIFIQSAEAEQKQMFVTSQKELLDAYFDALRHKEFTDLPEDADERWQIEAALDFVLPEIAGQITQKYGALTDTDLLKAITYCYRLFSAPLLRRAFPQWIGHTKAIRGDAKTAEEWHGIIVHDILWKRLGLLIRNDRGEYQIVHQIICEYLVEKARGNDRLIWRKRRIKIGILGIAAALFLTGGVVFYNEVIAPPVYQELLADRVMNYGVSVYRQYNTQYTKLSELISSTSEGLEKYRRQLRHYQEAVSGEYPSADEVVPYLDAMLKEGEVMPWSKKPLETEAYQELIERAAEYAEEYKLLVDALTYVMQNEKASERFGETYIVQLSELIEKDAEIISLLYQVSCKDHLNERYDDNSVEAKSYRVTMREQAELNQFFIKDLSANKILEHIYENLYKPRDDIQFQIYCSGLLSMME